MLFVADIGNTSISAGLYDGTALVETWSISTDRGKTEDEYGVLLRGLVSRIERIDSGIISSVVPAITERFTNALSRYVGVQAHVLASETKTGITLDVESPKEVGCDRIANACAAYNLYKTPAVVVDFGTATNFDVVTEDGRFIGGIIAPGLRFSAEAFSSFTNLLPKIKLDGVDRVVGRNTVQNMLSGVVIGHAAMIDGLIARVEEELQTPITTIATGGFSAIVTKHMKRPFDYFNPHLTLEGLRLIYEMNRVSVT
jgi:type III pantothenate kinase